MNTTRHLRSGWLAVGIGLLLALGLRVTRVASAQSSEFRNQMALLGTAGVSQQQYIDHARQMGYEWVVGDPWSRDKAAAADAAGLKVMFNSNADNLAKWYNFDNRGTESAPQNPTTIFGEPITAQQYQDFKINLCMTSDGLSMPDNQIYNASTRKWKYRLTSISDNSLIFAPNYYAPQAIAGNVQANINLMMAHGQTGSRPYSGLYFDETNFPGNAPYACYNPINGGNIGGTQDAFDGGRKQFIKALRARVSAVYGFTTKVSGNAWRADQYDPEQADPNIALDLIFSESSGGQDCNTLTELQAGPATGCGTQDTRTWGVVPIDRVDVQMASTGGNPEFEAVYKAGQLIAGRSAWQGGWFGFFGAVKLSDSNNATQLLRALPNWDNRVGVPVNQRSWNESTDVYNSPNSHIDNGVAYGRRWTDGKLFVVWNTNTAPVTLRSGESVANVKCVNALFLETTDCASQVTVSTTSPRTIRLNSSANQLKGYVMTLTGGTTQTPTISPNGGSFTGSVSVSLSTATSGATLYYTTNGTTPSTASTRYTAPFTVTASATVKALAVKAGLTNSAIASAAFTIVPVVNLLTNPGFESGATGWSLPASALITTTSGEMHTGTRALEMAAGAWAWAYQSQPASAGVSYRVSGWIKTQGATEGAKLRVDFQDSANNTLVTNSLPLVTGTTAYQQYSASFAAPVGTTKVLVSCVRPASSVGLAWFDDLSLTRE